MFIRSYYIFRTKDKKSISYVGADNLENDKNKKEFWDVGEILVMATPVRDEDKLCEMKIKTLIGLIDEDEKNLEPEQLKKIFDRFKLGRTDVSRIRYWPFAEVYINAKEESDSIDNLVSIDKHMINKPAEKGEYIIYGKSGGYFGYVCIESKDIKPRKGQKVFLRAKACKDADKQAENEIDTLIKILNSSVGRTRANGSAYNPNTEISEWIMYVSSKSKNPERRYWPFEKIEIL